MLNKYYIKLFLFIVILLIITLIIDNNNKIINLPISVNNNVELTNLTTTKEENEYVIYVSDLNNILFPVNIIVNKDKYNSIPYYNSKIDSQLDEDVFVRFSLITNFSNYLPKNTKTLIPQSTKLNSYKLSNDVIILDMSKEFLNYNKNEEKEILIQIIYTFTTIENINNVKILCEGKDVLFNNYNTNVFSQDNLLINVYFRTANITNATIYTIYYYVDIDDSFYLVPITVYEDSNLSNSQVVSNLLTSSLTIPVLSLLTPEDINNYYNQQDDFIDSFKYYQYYFSFYENNIISHNNNISIENINYYKIDLVY